MGNIHGGFCQTIRNQETRKGKKPELKSDTSSGNSSPPKRSPPPIPSPPPPTRRAPAPSEERPKVRQRTK